MDKQLERVIGDKVAKQFTAMYTTLHELDYIKRCEVIDNMVKQLEELKNA